MHRKRIKEFNTTSREYSNDWITPKWIIDGIGISDLDPCAFKRNGDVLTVTAWYNYNLQDGHDGLKQPWFGSVFCNPPYDDAQTWMKRCRMYHEMTGNDVILLLFCRSNTNYMQEELPHATGINLLPRVKFINGATGTTEHSAQAPSILIAYGERAYQRVRRVKGIPSRIDPLQ
jgi:hypothetical protein